MDIPAAKGIADIAPVVQTSFLKVVGGLLQFILPLVFTLAAIASGVAQLKRPKAPKLRFEPSISNAPRAVSQPASPADHTWPDQQEADTHPIYDSELPPQTQVDESRWSQDLLKALEWKRSEEVCAGLFDRLGFEAVVAGFGPDGGVDIHLYRPPSEKAVAIVQCKFRTNRRVGVETVRALHGVMASKQVPEGILVTTGLFSGDATAYARENKIDLMDGAAVLRSIQALPDDQQASLLALATSGDYTTPTCASCGIKMKKRLAKSTGKQFWGCVNYPSCRSIINIAKT